MKQFILFVAFFIVSLQGGPLQNVDDVPSRIVSLAPSVTEGIFLLGAGESLVGVTMYCDRPLEAKKKEKIGALLEPDIEKIVSLRPDLVLGTEDGNDPHVEEKLRGLGLRVEIIPPSGNFIELCEKFIILGRLIGREGRAQELVTEARKKMEKVQNRVMELPKKKVFWEIGAQPLVTIGSGGYLDNMTTLAGGENIAHMEKGAWLRYSREEVVRKNPDVIILVSMGNVGEEEVRVWSRYKNVTAVRKNKFLVMGPEATAPLPTDFVSGLETLARFLHPEVFAEKK